MPFPARLLQPGEEVLLDTRPRLWRLARPSLLVLGVVAGSAAVVALWVSAPVWFGWVLLAAFVLALARLAAKAAAWRAESLTVTTRRVVHRSGVLRRLSREIPVVSVQSVSYRQRLLQRLIGAGDLLVESAGADSVESFADVPDPAYVQSLVSAALERWRAATAAGIGDRLGDRLGRWGVEGEDGEETGQLGGWDTAPVPAYRAEPPGDEPPGDEPPGDEPPGDEPPGDEPPGDEPPGLPRSGVAPVAGAEVVAQIERLGALYERGLLTRREFESKKAELLARL